jgi:splicing factor 3B subunit 3
VEDYSLIIFRFIISLAILDHNTVACGDKFGNIFVLRLPEGVNDDMTIGNSSTAQVNLWDHGILNGAPNKVELMNHYYLAEIPTSIVSTKMKLDSVEVLIVSTITGGVYALLPNKSTTEATFFQQLEMFMRQEYTNLCQRDHLSFRSVYAPVKNIIDVSLCERFLSLPFVKQQEFAANVGGSASDIVKKLEEIRNFI